MNVLRLTCSIASIGIAVALGSCDDGGSDGGSPLGGPGGPCREPGSNGGRVPCEEGLVCYQSGGSSTCVEPTPVEGCPTTPDQLNCASICSAEQAYCSCSGAACGSLDDCVTMCEKDRDYWLPFELAEYGCLDVSGGSCQGFDNCISGANCTRDE